MSIILAFDTALGECSVALWKDGAIVAAEYEPERNRQTSQLVPMIESVMQKASLAFTNLSCIATTSGPGSFTGIRIGLSVARGLTLACGVPSLAVNTLELLAWQDRTQAQEKPIAVSINAYRGEIYTQSFCTACDGGILPHTPTLRASPCSDGSSAFDVREKLMPLTEAIAIPAEDWDATFPAEKYHRVTDDALRPDAAALAEYVALAALNPTDYPAQPFYIRAPDAKIQTPLLAL